MKTLKVRTIIDAMLLLAASSYQLYKEDILKKKETMTLQLVAFRPLLERYQNKEFFDHKADPEHADYHANHAMLDGDENYSLYGTSSAILHVLARAHDKHEYTDCKPYEREERKKALLMSELLDLDQKNKISNFAHGKHPVCLDKSA